MASFYSDALLHKQPLSTHSTTFSMPSRPKIRLRRRFRRLPIVHLGGKKPRRGFFLARLFRGARLKWLRLQYSRMFKKLKQYYKSMIKDIIDASATLEAYQQRMLMEASMAVPGMGVSFSNYHGGAAIRGPRSIFM